MEMTTTQRLILANQYKLMALLDAENAAQYNRLQRIVKGGFELELKEVSKEFLDLSEEECRIVRETLEMYNALQVSYNNLADKSDISEKRLQFLGYCAVRERKYLNYLQFIADTDSKYQHLLQIEGGFDAQTPMWDKYGKMLEVLHSCPHEYHLSAVEILNILNA